MKTSCKTRWWLASIAALAACCNAASSHAAGEFTLDTAPAAAAKGDPQAEFFLARHYAHGDGVSRDYAKAVAYLRQAAAQGYAPAQTGLGSCYARGEGVKQDYAEALRWYRQAAAQGDALAEYCLGYAWAEGKGVPKDQYLALRWWQKAAEQGQVLAQNALGQFYFQGDHPGDTNHINYTASARWLRKAAEQGYAPAMSLLGYLYQHALGVNQDWPEALKWNRQAAELGDAAGQANLGLMYEDGQAGLPHDKVQAYKWFCLSAEQGNPEGRHDAMEFQLNHALTSEQLAAAERMVTEFHARMRTNHVAQTPEAQTESAR